MNWFKNLFRKNESSPSSSLKQQQQDKHETNVIVLPDTLNHDYFSDSSNNSLQSNSDIKDCVENRTPSDNSLQSNSDIKDCVENSTPSDNSLQSNSGIKDCVENNTPSNSRQEDYDNYFGINLVFIRQTPHHNKYPKRISSGLPHLFSYHCCIKCKRIWMKYKYDIAERSELCSNCCKNEE